MKIIEIKRTTTGEVAYIFDETRGKVIKVLVEDYTGKLEEPEEIEDFAPRPKRTRPVEMPRYEEQEEEPEELPKPVPQVRKAKKPSIIPPHLRGVFLGPDQPGAAVERRDV